jgi:dihydropyrimidine dehydrogenase (NAD+) subunit PreA
MVYGFKIVQDMSDGLSNYMDEMGFTSIDEFRGRAVPTVTDWQHLNLNHISKAVINQDSCIQCGRCHIACEDTSHQAITFTKRTANAISRSTRTNAWAATCAPVCPVPECITLRTAGAG